MKMYRVILSRVETSSRTFHVRAESPEAAAEATLEDSGAYDFEPDDTDTKVVSVEHAQNYYMPDAQA